MSEYIISFKLLKTDYCFSSFLSCGYNLSQKFFLEVILCFIIFSISSQFGKIRAIFFFFETDTLRLAEGA